MDKLEEGRARKSKDSNGSNSCNALCGYRVAHSKGEFRLSDAMLFDQLNGVDDKINIPRTKGKPLQASTISALYVSFGFPSDFRSHPQEIRAVRWRWRI